MRWLIFLGIGGMLCASAARATPQEHKPAAQEISQRLNASSNASGDASSKAEAAAPVISEIEFLGLRRIAPAAVQAQISSRCGEKLDARSVENDVRTLARLGWFEDVRVERQELGNSDPTDGRTAVRVRLIYYTKELPYLEEVTYSGSRLFSRRQIEKMLGERQLTPRLGEPADPASLERVARELKSALAELGHPQAEVRIVREEFPNASEQIRFKIGDGPHLPVGRVEFEGHPEISTMTLRRQMQRIRPRSAFATLRGRDAYTRQGYEEDRERMLAYYQNHGYPEARIGNAKLSNFERTERHWLPWPHQTIREQLAMQIPVEAGPLYRIGSVRAAEELVRESGKNGTALVAHSTAEEGRPFSAQEIERLRRAWLAGVARGVKQRQQAPEPNVEASQVLDREKHTATVRMEFSNAPPYMVRRIEFQGLHRFTDKYLRRRILLQEGKPIDDRALEGGIGRIARTGYFKPIRKEDIQIRTDDLARTVDVTIRVREAGQQRASLVGGHGQFGSTIGMAYTVFDLLHGEELLSTQLEGGPESLQLMLGVAKEGFLGSRGALALSLFDSVIRPHLTSGVKGPFFTAQSEGLNAGWSYAVTSEDSFAVNYGLSHSNTHYSLALPAGLTGLPSTLVSSTTSSRSVGIGWTHDSGNERFTFANSVSGGLLGGNENLARSSGEFGRIYRDPFFGAQNAWAFRTTVSGVGSYKGDMPLYARFFGGDELVRGLRAGELGPDAVVSSESTSGSTQYSAIPAGANLVGAANLEYRMPLAGGTEAAGFFDLGMGGLLPNWLGKERPTLLEKTNAILHGSTGIELRWTVPGIQVPVRGYYAVNVLRLNRFSMLPDGTVFHAHDRSSAFGWALGTLF